MDTNLLASSPPELAKNTSEVRPCATGFPASDDHRDDGPRQAFESDGTSSDRPHFTEVKNPFLFPLDLLDEASDSWSDDDTAGATDQLAANNSRRADEGHFSHSGGDVGREGWQWWLIHTKPRQEKKLAEELRQLEIPHYLPVSKCKAVTRGRTRVTQAPQFPSYLFLCATADQRRRALQTNRIVASHHVVEHEMLRAQLCELADLIEKGIPLTVEARLMPGTWVRVKSGLLKDKEGTVIKRGGKTRLFVFVNKFLGGVSMEIAQHLLEPYGTPPTEAASLATVS